MTRRRGAWGAVLLLGLVGCAAPRDAQRAEPVPGASAEDGSVGALSGPAPAAVGATESVEAWPFGDVEGRLIRTTHYRLFTTETDGAIVGRAPEFLERAMTQYRTALGPLPPPPLRLDTFLMNNREQWRRLTLQLLGRQGERYLAIGRGGFAVGGRAFLYDIGLFDTLAIAAHEGWHQYTQRTFRDPLPVWLEEGVAVFMEGHRWNGASAEFLPWANLERFDQLRLAASRGELQPLEELLRSAPQDLLLHAGDGILTYYAQIWALTHFLNEGADGRYRSSLRTLLLDAAEGRVRAVLSSRIGAQGAADALSSRRGPDVFVAYLSPDLEVAGAEFDAFLSRLVRSGSRDAVAAGRSPMVAP